MIMRMPFTMERNRWHMIPNSADVSKAVKEISNVQRMDGRAWMVVDATKGTETFLHCMQSYHPWIAQTSSTSTDSKVLRNISGAAPPKNMADTSRPAAQTNISPIHCNENDAQQRHHDNHSSTLHSGSLNTRFADIMLLNNQQDVTDTHIGLHRPTQHVHNCAFNEQSVIDSCSDDQDRTCLVELVTFFS